jgi:hypothetical protein
MNTNPIRTLIAAACLAGIPALAPASDEQLAVSSCARALVASIATRSATPLKLRASHYTDSRVLVANHYEFMLVARRARDNAPVARALCRTDERDQVVELQEKPLYAPDF